MQEGAGDKGVLEPISFRGRFRELGSTWPSLESERPAGRDGVRLGSGERSHSGAKENSEFPPPISKADRGGIAHSPTLEHPSFGFRCARAAGRTRIDSWNGLSSNGPALPLPYGP